MTRAPASAPRLAIRALVVVAVGGAGCDSACSGPTCESTWSVTDLAMHRPLDWGTEVRPLEDATGVVLGTASQGVGWTVAGGDGRLLIGQPAARRVITAAPPDADASIADVAQGLVFVADDDGFGAAVEASGGWVVVGAPDADLGAGAVWFFRDLPDEGRVESSDGLRLAGMTPGDHTGRRVRSCPDVDGDGQPEWLITAATLSDTQVLSGGVWWVPSRSIAALQNGNLPIADVAVLWSGETAGSRFGTDVTCGWDLDGDAIEDVLIGAPFAGQRQEGSITLVRGASLADPTSPSTTTLVGPAAGDWLGSSVAVGVFDGSGAPMLVAGAPGGESGRGRVLLYDASTAFGPTVRRPLTVFTTDAGHGASSHLGRSVFAADLDGDGLDELVAGAPDATVAGSIAAGRLYVWRGANWPGQVVGDADHLIVGTHAFQRVGRWTSVVDAEGDGLAELYLALRADGDR